MLYPLILIYSFDICCSEISKLNCWVLHPVARVSTNAFLKTTVRNNAFVLDFNAHYLLHVSAPIGGQLQGISTQNIHVHSSHLNNIFCVHIT
jgi:hypothetical protein